MIAGIFVGGRGTRMGGVAKGLLRIDGETLVERLVRLCAGFEVVLVGKADAYASLRLPSLADNPADVGPIGGLHALLSHAESRDLPFVLALACDLPFVSATYIETLAAHPSERDVIASQSDGVWQPLAARYRTKPALDATRAAIAAQERSLQFVIQRLGAEAIVVDERELRDWDTPEDQERDQEQDTSTGEPSSG